MGTTVLVIGADSQIGFFLLPQLLDLGAEVLALTRREVGGTTTVIPVCTGSPTDRRISAVLLHNTPKSTLLSALGLCPA